MFHHIVKIEPQSEQKLWIEYEDGTSGIVDFSHLIGLGGVFEALSKPETFAQATIGADGRFIEWPGQIDFCADALREKIAFLATA